MKGNVQFGKAKVDENSQHMPHNRDMLCLCVHQCSLRLLCIPGDEGELGLGVPLGGLGLGVPVGGL